MKKYLISFLFVVLFFLKDFSQTDTIVVNGFKFVTVVKTEMNEYDGRDTLIKFYRIENGKAKYLLKHYTYKHSADCNNSFTDVGKYKIQNDSIVFLTEFLQKTGMDPIPEKRIQIFKVGEGGRLTLLYDKQQERFSGEWVETNYKNE